MRKPNTRILMWFDCKYCGKDFQSMKRKIFCDSCRHMLDKEPKNMSSTTMRRIRNREFITNYKKDRKCGKCGYNKFPEILDFHHKNRNEKSKGVCNLMKSLKNIITIQKEIDKCILLCPNCHRELHLKERNGKQKR